MGKHSNYTPGPWAWFRQMLVTANADGSIPLNAKVVLANNRDLGALEIMTAGDGPLIAASPQLLAVVRAASEWRARVSPSDEKTLAVKDFDERVMGLLIEAWDDAEPDGDEEDDYAALAQADVDAYEAAQLDKLDAIKNGDNK